MSQKQPRRPPKSQGRGDGDESGGEEIDRDTLLAPGPIVVGDREHRRLLETVGEADNERVEFVDDAAAMAPPDERDGSQGDDS
jgi:hypothetical protein